jgi:hypothetical protein
MNGPKATSALSPFDSQLRTLVDAFHRERRIPVRRGRSRHEAEQLYIRFCFPDTATADAFRNSVASA